MPCPDVNLVIQSPGKKRVLETIHKQDKKGWPELNQKIEDVYKKIYERLKNQSQ